MQRAAGLWQEIIALEALHRAAYRVLRGKRGKQRAGDFFRDLEGNLLQLQMEPSAPPADPDVPDSGIRLLESRSCGVLPSRVNDDRLQQ